MARHMIVFLLIISGMDAGAQRINSTQKLSATDSIKSLLAKYSELHRFTADGVSVSEEIIGSFSDLFISGETAVLNDIIPESSAPSGSQVQLSIEDPIQLKEYLIQVQNNYKRGLFVNLTYNIDPQDEAIQDKKNLRYILYVEVKKSITGMYQDSEVHRYEGEQVLKVSFLGSGIEVSDFRIAEIITPKILAKREVKDRWKGFYAGLTSAVGQNHLLYDHPFSDNPASHIQNSAQMSFAFGAMAQYNFGAGAGFQLEIVYRDFKVNQVINGYSHTDNTYLFDQDDDRYNRVTEVDSFSSELKISMIDIPVILNLRPYTSKNVAWTLQFGIRNQLILNPSSTLKGNVEYMGYYPDYPVLLYDLPEYGFKSEDFPGISSPVETDKYHLMGTFGTGLDFRISRSFLLSFGVRADYSIMQLNISHSSLSEEFSELILPSQSRLMVFNAYLGFMYKIY